MKVTRRDFIRLGFGGLSAVVLGSNLKIPGVFKGNEVHAADFTLNLTITDAMVEMADSAPLDRREVYMWVFADLRGGSLEPHFPGPAIFAREGDRITINITNSLEEAHAFAIAGTRISSSVMVPGGSTTLIFDAPRAGTYIYHDPLNAPVNRVLGLHGALVVLPAAPGNNPYSNPTAQAQRLFNDLGNSALFPGNPWVEERTWIWNFHSTDPAWNTRAQNNQPINRLAFIRNFVPSYFTINGKSGFYSGHDNDISPFGRVGEPAVIRLINTGLAAHSPHLHANHFYVTAVNGRVSDNIFYPDTFRLFPMDRVDWMVPFDRPHDIPPVSGIRNPGSNPDKLLRLDAPEELALVLGGVPLSPLDYTMHCHAEPSQTASGGNYPFGAMVHITFTGDIDGVLFPGGERFRRGH